jgi:hypothetical protein
MAYFFLPKAIGQIFEEPHKNTEHLVIYLAFLSGVVIISYFLIILANKDRRYQLNKARIGYFTKN